MRAIDLLLITMFAAVPVCIAQNGTVSVIGSGWNTIREGAKKGESQSSLQVPEMTAQNKNFQRNARENQMLQRGMTDPNEHTIDGRSAQLEKITQESRTPNYDAKVGYSYFANVKNDNEKTVVAIFWEYRFTEIATPANVTSRHFLCGVKIKPGDKRELAAASILGPSNTISVKSLENAVDKLFDEKVIINRIEFADDSVLNRRDWKYDDFKDAIKRATSTPWGKEVCRIL
ncbi:MAG: hypothetical protein IPG67_13565 [Acidobacteria bacterium]|nr:hypothetical protein [Acidobacteriota bacterium]